MKTCTKCGKPQKLTQFRKSKVSADGFKSWCKTCEANYAIEYAKRPYVIKRRGLARKKLISDANSLLIDPNTVLSPIESYLLGLLQTDGHFTGRCFRIEVSAKDEDIIHKVNEYFENKCHVYKRIRTTNFKGDYSSISLTINDKAFVAKMAPFIPAGKKSSLVAAPKGIQYSEKDYWRGVMDGDGSLGIKKDGSTFISIVTASEQLYLDYKDFLSTTIGVDINCNRNKRDNIYNLTLINYSAFMLTKLLYNDCHISINRKQHLASAVINHDYQSLMSNSKHKFTHEEDSVILKSPLVDSIKSLSYLHGSIISQRKRQLSRMLKSGISLSFD
jgi:hypothetical protein